MAEETRTVIHTTTTPLKLHLQKNKDGYCWEITASGANLDEVMRVLQEANAALKKEYGRRKK